MTGAPKIGVMAFRGIVPAEPGITLIRLHNNAMKAPVSIVTGNRDLWFDVPSNKRAICGTANPIKDIGPQYAVVIAVNNPAQSSNRKRTILIFTPKFRAYLSPKSRALSGLMSIIDIKIPMMTTME